MKLPNAKQRRKIQRDQERVQAKEVEENMKSPVNQFLNKTGEYPMAEKMRAYIVNNPDPIMDKMRMCNALLHEIRFHKENTKQYLDEHVKVKSLNEPSSMTDEHGRPMNAEQLYLKHIVEEQAMHISLSRLRDALGHLLATCDDDIFPIAKFDSYLAAVEKIVTELGLVLFPTAVEVMIPK